MNAETPAGADPPSSRITGEPADERGPDGGNGALERFSVASGPRRVGRGYSHFVRGMKLLLPTVAVGLIALLVAWPRFEVREVLSPRDDTRIRTEDAENLTMLDARFVGTDSKQRPFTVTADKVTQAMPKGNVLVLQQPKADITLQDGSWLAVTAERGTYDRGIEQVVLEGSVSIHHDDGYELHTSVAYINLKANTASGDQPVEGHGPMGELMGEGFRVTDGGMLITLTGRSTVLLRRAAEGK